MVRIRCFLIQQTDRVQVKLRRSSQEQTCPLPACAGFHEAATRIEDEPAQFDAQYTDVITNLPVASHDDPRWPTHCACGYLFQAGDNWQCCTDLIYRRQDTGEEMTRRDAPAGAMWESPWHDEFYTPQGDHNLVVMTPGGEWAIDGRSNNCAMPEDYKQQRHHCWPRRGVPPDVTVDLTVGPTCSAGSGSIRAGSYHGWLREGWLEDA